MILFKLLDNILCIFSVILVIFVFGCRNIIVCRFVVERGKWKKKGDVFAMQWDSSLIESRQEIRFKVCGFGLHETNCTNKLIDFKHYDDSSNEDRSVV